MLPLLFSIVASSPNAHHTISSCCHGMRTGSAPWWCTHLLRCGGVVWHREREREGKWCDEEEMGGASRWERCRTSVVLRVLCISIQQHMACQRTARLVMVISLPAHPPAVHGCPPSPPHDVVVKKMKGRREGEGAAMCLQKDQHTNVCTHTH